MIETYKTRIGLRAIGASEYPIYKHHLEEEGKDEAKCQWKVQSWENQLYFKHFYFIPCIQNIDVVEAH